MPNPFSLVLKPLHGLAVRVAALLRWSSDDEVVSGAPCFVSSVAELGIQACEFGVGCAELDGDKAGENELAPVIAGDGVSSMSF